MTCHHVYPKTNLESICLAEIFLHQEHLNRVVKDFIRGLGANKTEDAIMRIGKALGTLFPVIENFDEENNVYNPAGAHKPPSSSKDRDLIIENLLIM